MTDAVGFLRAITEEPDDYAHRLVFADWLEEHSEPGSEEHERAEFIRLQIQLPQLAKNHPQRPALCERERELRKRFRVQDKARLGSWGRAAVYQGGFIEGLTLWVDEFLEHAEELFASIPLREVRFGRVRNRLAELMPVLTWPDCVAFASRWADWIGMPSVCWQAVRTCGGCRSWLWSTFTFTRQECATLRSLRTWASCKNWTFTQGLLVLKVRKSWLPQSHLGSCASCACQAMQLRAQVCVPWPILLI